MAGVLAGFHSRQSNHAPRALLGFSSRRRDSTDRSIFRAHTRTAGAASRSFCVDAGVAEIFQTFAALAALRLLRQTSAQKKRFCDLMAVALLPMIGVFSPLAAEPPAILTTLMTVSILSSLGALYVLVVPRARRSSDSQTIFWSVTQPRLFLTLISAVLRGSSTSIIARSPTRLPRAIS